MGRGLKMVKGLEDVRGDGKVGIGLESEKRG